MRLRIISPDGRASELTVASAIVRLGRDPAAEVTFNSDDCLLVSARHARIDRTLKGDFLTPLSQSNKTLLNDRPVDGPVPLKVGDRIRLAVKGPTVEILSLPPPSGTTPPAAKPPTDSGATVQAAPQHRALLRGSLGTERMPVGQGGVIAPLTGPALWLAKGLITAYWGEQARRESQTVELVWTRPEVGGPAFRRTEQAILQILDSARQRITLVSDAVYRIPNICNALVRAAQRGVQINVIVETPDKLGRRERVQHPAGLGRRRGGLLGGLLLAEGTAREG